MSTVEKNNTGEAPPARRRAVVLLPLSVFWRWRRCSWYRLGAGDPSRIPSALIGREAPPTSLPPIAGLDRDGKPVPGLDSTAFKGEVTVLNVWASWCVPCHDEAPLLVKLAADPRIRVAGINYKDQPDNARRFSAATAIRSAANGADANGRTVDRVGRLRRAGELPDRPRRPYRLQIDRTDHPRQSGTVLNPEIAKALASRGKGLLLLGAYFLQQRHLQGANTNVSGMMPNTLKLTQKSVVWVRQTISLSDGQHEEEQRPAQVSLRQPSRSAARRCRTRGQQRLAERQPAEQHAAEQHVDDGRLHLDEGLVVQQQRQRRRRPRRSTPVTSGMIGRWRVST